MAHTRAAGMAEVVLVSDEAGESSAVSSSARVNVRTVPSSTHSQSPSPSRWASPNSSTASR